MDRTTFAYAASPARAAARIQLNLDQDSCNTNFVLDINMSGTPVHTTSSCGSGPVPASATYLAVHFVRTDFHWENAKPASADGTHQGIYGLRVIDGSPELIRLGLFDSEYFSDDPICTEDCGSAAFEFNCPIGSPTSVEIGTTDDYFTEFNGDFDADGDVDCDDYQFLKNHYNPSVCIGSSDYTARADADLDGDIDDVDYDWFMTNIAGLSVCD